MGTPERNMGPEVLSGPNKSQQWDLGARLGQWTPERSRPSSSKPTPGQGAAGSAEKRPSIEEVVQ